MARWAADAIVAQIDARTGSGQLGADFERSLKAYWERFPDDLRIQQRLARLAVELGITSVDQFLVPLADDGRLDVTAAHSLADGLVLKKQLDQALQLYRYVLERQPDNHLVLNNAAWVLAHAEPIDLAQAERLANRAVQLQPQDPHYRDTRGQIYVRLKQWHKAAEDLRMAINGLPHQSETHLALSVAYDHLGKKQLAEAYRRAARAGEPAP